MTWPLKRIAVRRGELETDVFQFTRYGLVQPRVRRLADVAQSFIAADYVAGLVMVGPTSRDGTEIGRRNHMAKAENVAVVRGRVDAHMLDRDHARAQLSTTGSGR